MKQVIAAKYGMRLRGWLAKQSDEDASEMTRGPNGTE